MFIIVLGQHVSILTESSSGPSKEIDPYLEMFKMRCGIPNAYILDKTMLQLTLPVRREIACEIKKLLGKLRSMCARR